MAEKNASAKSCLIRMNTLMDETMEYKNQLPPLPPSPTTVKNDVEDTTPPNSDETPPNFRTSTPFNMAASQVQQRRAGRPWNNVSSIADPDVDGPAAWSGWNVRDFMPECWFSFFPSTFLLCCLVFLKRCTLKPFLFSSNPLGLSGLRLSRSKLYSDACEFEKRWRDSFNCELWVWFRF